MAKFFETEMLRNVALTGHTQSGKTSLAEGLLWSLKQSERLGKTEEKNTLSDFETEEQNRLCSLNTTVIPFEHQDCKVNLIDIPGNREFLGEKYSGLMAAGCALLVMDATNGGVSTGAEFSWELADRFNLPHAVFINKLDKENTSFETCLQALHNDLGARVIPLTLPVGEAENFKAVIDLIRMKMVVEDDQNVSFEDIPADMKDAADAARAELVEAAAEGDEELMEKFLDTESLDPDEVLRGLQEDVTDRSIVPVFCGSATLLKGLRPLANFMVHCFPSPAQHLAFDVVKEDGEHEQLMMEKDGDVVLYVFKTLSDPFQGKLSYFKVVHGILKDDATLVDTHTERQEKLHHLLTIKGKETEGVAQLAAGDIGAIAKHDAIKTGDTLIEPGAATMKIVTPEMPAPIAFMAVKAKSRADEDKVGMGFHRLVDQDPSLKFYRDDSIRQTILAGMGETHLQVTAARLKELSKVEVDLEVPRVPYRETITAKAEGQGKHKKQSGGHGQYGDCWIRFEPLPEGSGFEFEWAIVGGVIPTNYQTAVEKGIQESLDRGVLSGSPTVDVKATCYDGSYHAVDSSDMAFKVAASMAFKSVIPKCKPVILEPIYNLTITVPEEYMGDVMGDLNGRRGRIMGMDAENGKQIIKAQVPLSEIYTYSRTLNSISQGRGVYEMGYDHYERVPGDVQEKIIEEAKRLAEDEEA